MARNDVTIKYNPYGTLPTQEYDVDAGTAISIKAGEPVKKGATGYVGLCADGDPEIGTDVIIGIAKSDSNDTTTVDGKVEVYQALPGVIYRCKATTPANVDTAAERLAVIHHSVTFDLSGSVFTVDEDEADDPDVHGLIIIDVDISTGYVYFMIHNTASLGGAII